MEFILGCFTFSISPYASVPYDKFIMQTLVVYEIFDNMHQNMTIFGPKNVSWVSCLQADLSQSDLIPH